MKGIRFVDGRGPVEGPPRGAVTEAGLERVNEVVEQLADIVFNETPQVGISALVSMLATMLSVLPAPQKETAAIAQMLFALVDMNCSREEAVSIYRM